MKTARLLSLLWTFALACAASRAGAAGHDGIEPIYTMPMRLSVNPDSVGQYGYKTTSNNLCNITFTNSGAWGVGYTSSTVPNFKYPAGSSLEHMVHGGLWIGALIDPLTGGPEVPVVSFGGVDQNGGVSSPLTEFTPLPNTASTRVVERSILPNSPFFNHDAISEQDYVMDFRDDPGAVVLSEAHVPLHVNVREETYSWSFEFAQSFVIQHLTIRNYGQLLHNVYVTHYSELQSLNKASYPNYPNQLTPAPYDKKQLTWYPDRYLVTEHYCDSRTDCHFEKVPAIAGIKMLGTRPDTIIDYNPKIVTRIYSGTFDLGTPYARDNDADKYAFMQLPEQLEDQSPGTSDPSIWLTIGPIPTLNYDDSISVDFAFVGGLTEDDILEAADHAQLAFDLHYNLPTPPPSPRVYARPVEQGVELLWEGSPDTTFDKTSPPGEERDFEGYRIYKGDDVNNLKEIANFDLKDSVAFNNSLAAIRLPADSVVVMTGTGPDGTTFPDTMKYHYIVRGLRDGFKYFFAVTSFDRGNVRIESLESGLTQNRFMAIPGPSVAQAAGKNVVVFPNPYKVEARWDYGTFAQDHYLWFANLPPKCKIRVYTLGGDLVKEVDFDAATYHGVDARGVFSAGRDFGIDPPTLSGSLYAWDMISNFTQAVASGMYLYSVEEPNGRRQVGKFVVIKSDRQF